MNKIKTTRSILSAVIVAAALGLVACGGGGSGAGSIESALPAGAIATVGDGVNLAEYNAITCGMPKAEVRRIIADAPTGMDIEIAMSYTLVGGLRAAFSFSNDLLKQKEIGNGKAAGQVDLVKC